LTSSLGEHYHADCCDEPPPHGGLILFIFLPPLILAYPQHLQNGNETHINGA
jgi:hypothetical protein